MSDRKRLKVSEISGAREREHVVAPSPTSKNGQSTCTGNNDGNTRKTNAKPLFWLLCCWFVVYAPAAKALLGRLLFGNLRHVGSQRGNVTVELASGKVVVSGLVLECGTTMRELKTQICEYLAGCTPSDLRLFQGSVGGTELVNEQMAGDLQDAVVVVTIVGLSS